MCFAYKLMFIVLMAIFLQFTCSANIPSNVSFFRMLVDKCIELFYIHEFYVVLFEMECKFLKYTLSWYF